MIPITLTKPEAKLCRDAAKHDGSTLFVDAGQIELERPLWHDLSLALTRYSCRPSLKIDTRQAAERLATRIDAVIAYFDRERARRLETPKNTVHRDLFAGAGT